MSENLSIGKDNHVNDSTLTQENSSTRCDDGPKPAFTEYRREGNKLITTQIYLKKDQGLISDFFLNGPTERPQSYEDDMIDEFLSIGRKYDSVDYPSSEVLENGGEYREYNDGNGDGNPNREPHGGYTSKDGLESLGESDLYDTRNTYSEYDFNYLSQFESYDSDDNQCTLGADTDDSPTPEGIALDHDLSEGFSSKPNLSYQYQKDEPYLGRGLDSDIPRHEQPREKALRLGIDALSDAELLALLFGTGVKGQNVLEMSRQILSDNMNHLSLLARLSPQELTRRYKGIGQAKAIMLCAAMALGIRAERDAHSNQLRQIDSSLKAYNLLRPQLQWIEHEEFWVIFLTKSNNLKNCCCVSRGGISETIVDVRIVIQRALQESASSMILVHNHPGSLLVPSKQDDELTIKIAEAARFFDIQVLDHIIIGASGYYSFKEHNHMRF